MPYFRYISSRIHRLTCGQGLVFSDALCVVETAHDVRFFLTLVRGAFGVRSDTGTLR